MNPRGPARLVLDGWFLLEPHVGMGVYLRRLIEGLARHRPDLRPEVVAPARLRGAAPVPAGVRISLLAAPGSGFDALDKALWQSVLARFCRRHRAGALLFSQFPYWTPLDAPPLALACHDLIWRRFPRYAGRRWLRRFILRKAEGFLGGAPAVITASESAAADIGARAGIGPGRLEVIPHWLPPEYTPSSARSRAGAAARAYGLPGDGYWLYVGGYDYRKNVETLLSAYAAACGRAACPPLVLAGRVPGAARGPVCDVRGELARLPALRDRVVTPGFIAEPDMPGLYAGARLLIYPSLWEGFGLPPLEAMGCGCPAVVADNSSLPEVVRDAEYRFPGRDADALAGLLARAAANPLPLNPSFRAGDFDERAAIARYGAVFDRLLAGLP